MKTVLSRDGTRIAYEQLGSGPHVLLVDGAMCSRKFGPMPKLAPLLAQNFTVFHYDRRGRGDSGNTLPYSVERELEDIQALVAVMGGTPCLYGTSSGAVLAIRAVASGVKVKRLVLHEPPLALDGTHHPSPADFREQIAAMVNAGRGGDAVKLFLKVVGVPAVGIFFMRLIPGVWRNVQAASPTLPYDFAVLGDTQSGNAMPAELAQKIASIDVPTLVLIGGKSPPWMHHAVKRVMESIRGAEQRLLPGQEHNVSENSVAPVLKGFFSAA